MSKRWLGLSATKDEVICVDVAVPNDGEPIVVLADDTWKVPTGKRADAYNILYQQCADYVRDNKIDRVIVKASAVMGRGAARLGMLHSAEVRGVIIAAASSVCPVSLVVKGTVSRTYGDDRKVDEYVANESFWAENTTGGKLRKKSREVTMLLISERND